MVTRAILAELFLYFGKYSPKVAQEAFVEWFSGIFSKKRNNATEYVMCPMMVW